MITSLSNVKPPNNPLAPTLSSPEVLMFSSPKFSAPDEEVIEPFDNVMSPITEPDAACTVPVITELPFTDKDVAEIPPVVKSPEVIKSSFLKSISPDADVIAPVPKVISPITELAPAVIVPVVLTLFELNEIPVSPEDTIEPLEIVTSPNEPLVVADTVVRK